MGFWDLNKTTEKPITPHSFASRILLFIPPLRISLTQHHEDHTHTTIIHEITPTTRRATSDRSSN